MLAFAQQLKADLEAIGTFDVHLTRTDDVFIPLSERVNIAHHHNADLFISLHADALADKYARLVRGATVYTLSEEASDEQARALAAKENRADLIAGMELDETQDEVNMILIDLMRRETKNFSIAFGRTMLSKLKGQVPLNKKPMRSADFRVLRAPDIPSVLLELGYLTNPEDEKLLTSEDVACRGLQPHRPCSEGVFQQARGQSALLSTASERQRHGQNCPGHGRAGAMLYEDREIAAKSCERVAARTEAWPGATSQVPNGN